MKIYEMRAYLGKERTCYTQIFATLEAAVNRAIEMEKEGGIKFGFGSAIYELIQVGDTFKFDCFKSLKVYLN